MPVMRVSSGGQQATGSVPVACYQITMRSESGSAFWVGYSSPYPRDPPGTPPQSRYVFWPVPIGTYVIQVSALSPVGWGPAVTTGVVVR